MHPELFRIGDFVLPTYGAAFAFSIGLGLFLTVRRSVKEGLDEIQIMTIGILAILGVIFGSKLMHVIINFDAYMEHPQRLFNLRKGHVFYGGYIGAVVVPTIYVKIKKLPFFKIIDICATYMGLGLATHRAFGCFSAGCCFGKPTDVPWGVVFPVGAPAFKRYGELAVHPTQLYEALLGLIIFFTLLYWRKYQKKVPGELITLQVALYGIGRFIIEIFRGDIQRGIYGFFSTSQWVSIGMVVIAGALTIYLMHERKKLAQNPQPESATTS